MAGSPEVTADNWLGVTPSRPDLIEDLRLAPAFRLAEPWPAMAIAQQSAQDAYNTVLARVGASLHRDSVDARIIEEVRTGTATYDNGIISSQTDVGGWPELESLPAPEDSDGDGIPDWWRRLFHTSAHELGPTRSPLLHYRLDATFTKGTKG